MVIFCVLLINIMKKKQILIINTGGTISCVRTQRGLEPTSGYVEAAFASLSILKHPELPYFQIKEYQPLIDSSNITIEVWNQLVQDIHQHYDEFDGFIIFHGTDTMAYTASALSFMLQNLGKPVILTGSQLPLSEIRSDAIDNTLTSLLLCAKHSIHEVCIYFNQKLLRGNRARKLRSHRFDAFDSPNFPALGTIGIDFQLDHKLFLPKPHHPFSPQYLSPQAIANFRLFPGFSLETLKTLLESPIKALILETYGTGNAPNQNPEFLQLLRQAIERGVIVVNATQCVEGYVESHFYATGRALDEIGVLHAMDMTPEALHMKLLYALSVGRDLDEVRGILGKGVCGEMGVRLY